jgi:hypothetical protein
MQVAAHFSVRLYPARHVAQAEACDATTKPTKNKKASTKKNNPTGQGINILTTIDASVVSQS